MQIFGRKNPTESFLGQYGITVHTLRRAMAPKTNTVEGRAFFSPRICLYFGAGGVILSLHRPELVC